MRVKLRIMLVVTLQLALGYALMEHTSIGRRILIAVWAGLMLFFLFGLKTRKDRSEKP